MELSKQQKVIDRKFAYNTGKLPGFADGDIASQYGGWQKPVQFDPNAQRPLDMPTGEPDFAGVKNSVNRTLNSINPGGEIDTLEGPTNKVSKQLKVGNIQTAASALPGFVGNMVGSWTNYESKDEILAKYHPMQASIGGIGFNKLTKNKNGKLPGYSFGNVAGATASGASMGSVAGPWGAVVGGAVGLIGSTIGEIISGDKQRKHEQEVAEWVKGYNNGERGGAISKAMQLYNQKTYGDQYTQSLIPHANGKIPGFENGLASATGPVNGEATARVSNGEVIANKWLGTMYRVPGLKNNKDGKLAALNNSDTVITNKYGLSDYAWRTGDITGAEKMMQILTKPNYKCGKLPKCAEGWLGNGIPATLGSIAGLSQYIDAKNSRPYYPRTYVANPYEGEALNTLAGLRINPYPITRELRDAEARSNRAIDIAGGLSGSQRTAARLAALNTTQSNISKLLSDIQQQNNAYRANYAQAAINAGQQARTARMAANQWDLDYYSKAHAARNRGIQTGIANMLAQIQQYQANEFKRRQFNETMNLYRDDMDQRKKNFEWYQNNALNVNNNPDPTKNPGAQYFNQMSPYEKWMLLQNRGIIR